MKEDDILLSSVGDISFHGLPGTVLSQQSPENMLKPFSTVLNEGDIVFGNLECPLSERGKGITKASVKLRGETEMVKVLKYLGFNVLNFANNHIMDYDTEAFFDTLELLADNDIAFVGAGRNIQEARAAKIISIRNKKVGFLSFCEDEGTIAGEVTPGAALLKEKDVIKSLRNLKSSVDYIVLSLHMGMEMNEYPTPMQIAMCRRFIDNGAHLILGHHPHVPQGYEYYKKGLIVYSLGNFIFDMLEPIQERFLIGFVYQIKLSNIGPRIIKVIPYHINHDFMPVLPTTFHSQNILSYLQTISEKLNDEEFISGYWRIKRKAYAHNLVKGLIHRIFSPTKYHTLFNYLKIIFKPQVRSIWTSYFRDELRDKFLRNG